MHCSPKITAAKQRKSAAIQSVSQLVSQSNQLHILYQPSFHHAEMAMKMGALIIKMWTKAYARITLKLSRLSDNLFIMASESIIIKPTLTYNFFSRAIRSLCFALFCTVFHRMYRSSHKFFYLVMRKMKKLTIFFAWLVSHCHFLFIQKCLLLNHRFLFLLLGVVDGKGRLPWTLFKLTNSIALCQIDQRLFRAPKTQSKGQKRLI